MTGWNISEEATELHRNAIVWDMLIPLAGHDRPPIIEEMLQTMVDGGYTYVSFTVATDWHNINETVHAQENLAATDAGVGKLRNLVRRGIRAVKMGKPFISPRDNVDGVIPTYTQDTVIPDSGKSEGDAFICNVGAKVAEIVLKSASYPAEQRKEEVARAVRALSF